MNLKQLTSLKRPTVILLFILGVAALVRLYALNRWSFWDDEIVYIIFSRKLLPIISGTCPLKTSLLFVIFLNQIQLISSNELFLKLIPVIFGVFDIFLIYLLVKELFNNKTAIFASFLLALSPLHIYFSRELSPYFFYLTFSLLSMLYCNRLLVEEKATNSWKYWGIFNALLLYTHYFSVLLILLETIFVVIFAYLRHSKPLIKKLLLAHIATFFLFFPYFIIIVKDYIFELANFNSSWIPSWELSSLLNTFLHIAGGYHSPYKLSIIIASIFIILILITLYQESVKLNKAENSSKRGLQSVIYLFTILLGTIIVVSLLAQWKKIYVERYFIYILIPFLILVARGLSLIKNKFVIFIIPIFLSMFLYIPISFIYINRIPREQPSIFMKKDIRGAAIFLKKHVKKGDFVVNSSNAVLNSINYYIGHDIKQPYVAFRPLEFKHFEKYSENVNEIMPDILPHFLPTTVQFHNRVWLIYSSWKTAKQDDEPKAVKAWFDKYYKEVSIKHFFGIDVILFESKHSPIN